jgi:hypothetical protein
MFHSSSYFIAPLRISPFLLFHYSSCFIAPLRVSLLLLLHHCICKEKNGKDMIGMHYVGHFSL